MLLVGFSLGTQVVGSGLLDPDLGCKPDGDYKVVFLAPALDTSFINNGLCRFANVPVVHQTSVFLNRDDRAVKAAKLIARRNAPSSCSTDFQQLAARGNSFNQIRILDITCETSKKHSIVKYALSPTLRNEIADKLNQVFALSNSQIEMPTLASPILSGIEDESLAPIQN